MKERATLLNEILAARGSDLRVEYQIVWKNNVEKEAYVLRGKSNAAPVMYRGAWLDKPNEDVADFICKAYSEHALMADIGDISDPYEVLQRILPRISSSDNREMMERADICFLESVQGLLTSFYIPVTISERDDGCLQLTNTLLDTLMITPDEAYAAAVDNMSATIDVKSMGEMLAEISGIDMGDEPIGAAPMTVITNRQRSLGAAAILCPETFKLLKERLGTDQLIVLPSSIHEVIVVTADEEADLDAFRNMVREVNDTQVSAEDRLSYNVYGWRDGVLQAIA